MSNTKQAIKAQKSSLKKRIFNLRRKDALKKSIKELNKKILAGNRKEAEKVMPSVYKAIDKAVKRGIIKKNTASRKKSRLVKLVKKIK